MGSDDNQSSYSKFTKNRACDNLKLLFNKSVQPSARQRCQMIFSSNPQDLMRKSARIRQMPLKPFFTPGGRFVVFFSVDFALAQEWPKQNICLC
jgi:hypothetical protein